MEESIVEAETETTDNKKEADTGSTSDTQSQLKPLTDTDQWSDLPFDQFLDESWHSVMRRDPELITELGLSEAFGMGNEQLTDISDAYKRQTYDLYAQILETLKTHDRASLSPEQQLNYDIYAYYLEDTLQGQEFMYHGYPITHFVTGVQYQLINFFTDIHPVTNKKDAEDYIRRYQFTNHG